MKEQSKTSVIRKSRKLKAKIVNTRLQEAFDAGVALVSSDTSQDKRKSQHHQRCKMQLEALSRK